MTQERPPPPDADTLSDGHRAEDSGAKTPGNSSARDVAAEEYREKGRRALNLRRAGASYEQIATALGYADKSGAKKLVKAALKDIGSEEAKEVIAIELERLDVMWMKCWEVITAAPSPGETPKAAMQRLARAIEANDPALRIMERRMKLLGLDKVKIEHTGKDGAALTGGVVFAQPGTSIEPEYDPSGGAAPAT